MKQCVVCGGPNEPRRWRVSKTCSRSCGGKLSRITSPGPRRKQPFPILYGNDNPMRRPEVAAKCIASRKSNGMAWHSQETRDKIGAAQSRWIDKHGMSCNFQTYTSGRFRPIHPHKYKGNVSNIIYRSAWELKVMTKLDTHPNIIEWSSEEDIIYYKSPVDGRTHRYFPDFRVKLRDINGNINTIIYEVKPIKQTRPPESGKRVTKKYLRECTTYVINEAKWAAAKKYCDDKQWKFQILTEHDLGINNGK